MLYVIRDPRSRRMKPSAFKQIAIHLYVGCSHLPLELIGQARPGPAGESISLVIAHMAYGFVAVYLAHARAGELQPFFACLFPVQRGLPCARLNCSPRI